jgi:DNA-binding NarL/FixJ family response regulator
MVDAPPTKVMIVDDHSMVAESFVRALSREPDLKVVAVAGTRADAVTAAAESEPDVILMDYVLPDGDGVTAAAEILAILPNARTILITGAIAPQALPDALTAGCVGYLEKTGPLNRLADAIRSAASGGLVLSVENLARAVAEPRTTAPTALTNRETEVLAMLGRGLSTKAIAGETALSTGTVNAHVAHILSKLNVHSRLEAVAVARRQGLIQDG